MIRFLLSLLLLLPLTPALAQDALSLPASLQGKAEVLAPTDADYPRADVAGAVKPPGDGGISQALVIRLTQDIPVYRLWNGPDKKDAQGRTNRLGQWWSYDAPHGTQAAYRTDYEICQGWNDLTYVATCTLTKGAVVAIGPGQSVSAGTCGDPTGQEAYAANPQDWQVFISKVWNRTGEGKELVCPPEATDYKADPANIARAEGAQTTGDEDKPKGRCWLKRKAGKK